MLKTAYKRFAAMGELPFSILRGGLLIAIALLLSSLAFLIAGGPVSVDTYEFHKLSDATREMVPVILFETAVLSAWAESKRRKK